MTARTPYNFYGQLFDEERLKCFNFYAQRLIIVVIIIIIIIIIMIIIIIIIIISYSEYIKLAFNKNFSNFADVKCFFSVARVTQHTWQPS